MHDPPATPQERPMGQVARERYTQDQINQFVSAHERFYRGEPRGHRAIMRFLQAPGIDFSGRILIDADFSGANMRGANFAMANLERASLYCADLGGVDARGANMYRADLRGCSLRQADLSGARLDDADMREAVLAKLDLDGGFRFTGRSGRVQLDGSEDRAFAVDFTNCSMKDVKLQKAKLKGANFSGAVLNGANLSGAVLDGATFDGAAMIGVDLSQASIDADALKTCVLDPSADAVERADDLIRRLKAAERWITTIGAEGGPAILDGEDLRPLGDAFENAQLAALSSKGACGIGVNFRGAQLQGARFDDADLRDADFSGADLRGASFRGAKLWHARFSDADLRPLPLASGVRRVDLGEAQYASDAFACALSE
jgi:uncharacterized protein YjbI with pentapeptide repeats